MINTSVITIDGGVLVLSRLTNEEVMNMAYPTIAIPPGLLALATMCMIASLVGLFVGFVAFKAITAAKYRFKNLNDLKKRLGVTKDPKTFMRYVQLLTLQSKWSESSSALK